MTRTLSFLALATIALGCQAATAADANNVFTNPAEAGPDFAVQGEYVGAVRTEQGEEKYGVQVIALGGGKFQAVGYHGGLPGEGWDRSERILGSAETKDGKTTFSAPDKDVVATLTDGAITIQQPNGAKLGTLKKVERQSPTMGAKPPAGAVVLFDGTTADNFQGGRMTDDKLLMQGATSKQLFQSFTLHLEFRTPFQPAARGQGRGNSGFYAQGRYEVQVLDSFGLEGKNNECGGIYTIKVPDVNMCLPPLAWQTYDVDYTAARYEDGKKVQDAEISVRHNGVVIHDKVKLPHATTAAPVREGPEPGPIYLQDHGNPVRYRNIWVVAK
jgi:hypothetical protein